MNNKLLKTTLSVSLVLATLVGAKAVYAQNQMSDLNLTEAQIEQLKEYRESKKDSRQAQQASQLEADKAALSEFLTDEQVEAIMNKKAAKGERSERGEKGQKGSKMKKGQRGGNNLLKHAEALDLTENQVEQIKTIIESSKPEKVEGAEKPTRDEMQANREAVKSQIQAVLTDDQVAKLTQLQEDNKDKKGANSKRGDQ